MIFTTAGAWVRTLLNTNIYFLLMGNILCGIGQPFLLNASALLAATWFSESNRAFITTVASMANNMGSVIGALFPTFFITAGADPDTAKSEIQGQYLYQAIIASVILVPNFLF